MKITSLLLKFTGGLFAAGIVFTALAAHPVSANPGVCKPGPCPPDTRPDLVVSTSLQLYQYPNGGPTAVTFFVKNQGLSVAAPSTLKVFVNGQLVKTTRLFDPLAPGASVATAAFVPTQAGGKGIAIQVLLDVDNEVDESNEGNNQAWQTFFH